MVKFKKMDEKIIKRLAKPLALIAVGLTSMHGISDANISSREAYLTTTKNKFSISGIDKRRAHIKVVSAGAMDLSSGTSGMFVADTAATTYFINRPVITVMLDRDDRLYTIRNTAGN